MFKRTVDPEDLQRLESERFKADRAYNDALTALDHALQRMPDLPHPPPEPDARQLPILGELLAHPEPDFGEDWRSRLRRFVWGAVVRPSVLRQQEFNTALLDHLERVRDFDERSRRAVASTLDMIGEQLEKLISFQSLLLMYAQQITGYVDTKDHEQAGLAEGRLLASMGGVVEERRKRREALTARERRYASQVNEVQTSLGNLQQLAFTLKREVERLAAGAGPAASPAEAGGETPGPADVESYKYVGFENQFRGSPERILERLKAYVPCFEGASDVLDVGCGRGEFLNLLREQGIGGRGLDINHEMVEICGNWGLEAHEGDVLAYLTGLPDGALGGLFAAQVVEHFEPDYLIRMLEVAYHKMRPGSKIVLETINPACWYAFFESYIRDITHVRPLHPDTLKYLMVASGFQKLDVRYREPYPDDSKLQAIAWPEGPEASGLGEMGELIATVNENTRKLNALLFTHLDYAAIGERL